MTLPKELTTVTPLSKTIALLMLILLPVITFFYGMKFQQMLTKQVPNTPVKGCTKELKICPDGTGVGRTGPNCEFAPCPALPPEEEGVTIAGTITDLSYDCHFDGICAISLDSGIEIIVMKGMGPEPEVSGRLIGIELNEDNKKEYLGREVNAYARMIDDQTYTLYGNRSFYVELTQADSLTCGGFSGEICPRGFYCVYEDGTGRAPYPDASGTCVRISRADDGAPVDPN